MFYTVLVRFHNVNQIENKLSLIKSKQLSFWL